MRSALIVAGTLALSACATPRMHTQAELNDVTEQCGLALGELIQVEGVQFESR